MQTIAFDNFDPTPSRLRLTVLAIWATRTPSSVPRQCKSPSRYGWKTAISDISSTVYTTVIATVFHVGTGTAGSDYVTRKITPYTPPGQKKRELTDALAPTPTAALELRQAALPTFASSCGGDASRVSSACTCLIGVTASPSVIQLLYRMMKLIDLFAADHDDRSDLAGCLHDC